MLLAFMPSPFWCVAVGLVFGGAAVIVLEDSFDRYAKRRDAMPVPDNVNAALLDLQTAQESAQAKAASAAEKEVAAVQARDTAEAAKVEGKAANDTLDQKRAAFVALVASTYNAPTLPPPAMPPAAPIS